MDPFYQNVWKAAYQEATPISGSFELTPRCNFNCCMCYVHLKENQILKYGEELTAKQWIQIAEEARKEGTIWLTVTGGEPLLHPEFEIIWKELCNMGFFITLQTNAFLAADERYLELFERYPPRSSKITLYGATDETYERVCGIKNGFSTVSKGIQNLRKIKVPIQLVSTIIKQNQKDVEPITKFALQNKIPVIFNSNIKKSIRIKAKDISKIKMDNSIEENTSKIQNQWLEKYSMDLEKKPCMYCRDYRIGYWITWNGNMQFCSFMNDPKISMKHLSFKTAWRNLVEYEEALDWPDECKKCEIASKCFKCAGLLATECGSPMHVTEEFCNEVKKRRKGFYRNAGF